MTEDDRKQDRLVQSGDLIKYQTYANALVKLNNATNTLLRSGANEEAIKYILQGTNILFEELTELLQRIDNQSFFSDLIEELNIEESVDRKRKSTPSSSNSQDSSDRVR
jgi:hypothetical protein